VIYTAVARGVLIP